MKTPERSEPPQAEDYVDGVRAGDRSWLARTVTLVESTLPADRAAATEVLEQLAPHAADAHRVGVTGPPGAGKSTLIDALGTRLCEQGHRVAVLAVDPSSAVSGGSILGDKTRMARLAGIPAAFVRPSPSGGALGGITGATLEAVEVVEAAGFDVVFIETVGVGQSEAGVADICDTVLAVTTPAGGDELQGIKRGLFEVTDILVVNKADGDLAAAARRSVADYAAALRLLHPGHPEGPRGVRLGAPGAGRQRNRRHGPGRALDAGTGPRRDSSTGRPLERAPRRAAGALDVAPGRAAGHGRPAQFSAGKSRSRRPHRTGPRRQAPTRPSRGPTPRRRPRLTARR